MAINMRYVKAFFGAILRSHYKDPTIEVLWVEDESPAKEIGDHYQSEIIRIHVKLSRRSFFLKGKSCFTTETPSFILKREPGEGYVLSKMIRAEKLFTVEHRMLKDIVPRIEAAIGVRLGPKLFYASKAPPRAIVMEDLTQEGFCLKNNQEGLSMAHATMAIQNLARFHAGSVILSEENPEALKNFKQGIFNDHTHPNIYVLMINSLNRLCEDAMTWPGENLGVAVKQLKAIIPVLKDRVREVYEYEEGEFCVLNHGDPRIGNILFKEDESGNPLEQVFVDYQMARYSSPAVDLLVFFGINPAVQLRDEYQAVLLKSYLDTLTSSMKKLRCKTEPPTMKDLKNSMHRRRAYAVACLFFLPRFMLDKEDYVQSIEQLLERGTFKVNPYEKPKTIRVMKEMLRLMSARGYLDPL